jgi:hypothetical protein
LTIDEDDEHCFVVMPRSVEVCLRPRDLTEPHSDGAMRLISLSSIP